MIVFLQKFLQLKGGVVSNYRNLADALIKKARQIENSHSHLNLVQTITKWRNQFYFGLYTMTPEHGRNVAYLLLSNKWLVKGVVIVLKDNHPSLEFHILADKVEIPHHSAYLILDRNGGFTLPENFEFKQKLKNLPPLIKHARLDCLKTYN